MNIAIILAGGTGQRMGIKGLPKQFLELHGKPIICYTLSVFQNCEDIDEIIIPCNKDWVDYMKELVNRYNFTKVSKVIDGGPERQSSMLKGLLAIENPVDSDIVLIHDGVRPLISEETIKKNLEVAKEKGNAMTVKPNIETVVITDIDTAEWNNFKSRELTFTLTSPQTFKTKELLDIYKSIMNNNEFSKLPDASMVYAKLGKKVYMVKDEKINLKVTTPEDFYYLKAYLELNENKKILGL